MSRQDDVDPLVVPCPICKEPAGSACKTPGVTPEPGYAHIARIAIATVERREGRA